MWTLCWRGSEQLETHRGIGLIYVRSVLWSWQCKQEAFARERVASEQLFLAMAHQTVGSAAASALAADELSPGQNIRNCRVLS